MVLKKTSRAFTLVELLVVISIIALLLSVLMPALGKARAMAQATVCSSRLHQLGLATMLYVQNYNNKYFLSYANGQQAWASSAQGAELQRYAGTKAGFYPGSIFDCPTQKPRGKDQGPYWGYTVTLVPFVGYLDYAYNACLGDGDILSKTWPAPRANIKQASATVMYWDSIRYRGYYCKTLGSGAPNQEYWNNTRASTTNFSPLPSLMQWPHSKGANFVFVDGHAEKANEKKVTDAWFNPGF